MVRDNIRCAREWRHPLRPWSILLLCLWLAACASPPIAPRAENIFDDSRFAAPSETVRADDLFVLSDAMTRYLDTEVASQLRSKGARDGLIDALYSRNQLRLEYDGSKTRTASQAFEARAGNCLSLVIMTSAFAKRLGLPVHYQSVYTDESWSRSGGIYFVSGHVNLSLGRRLADLRSATDAAQLLTIDFLPAADLRGQRSREVSETTVVAMYMNNRAAEALSRGQLDDAYGWARAAITQEPTFMSSYNTLGVIYLHHGDPALAQRVLERVLEREPANTRALSNLARVFEVEGRAAEARALGEKLAQLETTPPFHFFDLGVAAMRSGDYKAARELFMKEIDREAYYHEFHFWLALAHYGLGDMPQARKQLTLAMETSPTRENQSLYAAKLDWIKTHRTQ